jgi:hypothetical protein
MFTNLKESFAVQTLQTAYTQTKTFNLHSSMTLDEVNSVLE